MSISFFDSERGYSNYGSIGSYSGSDSDSCGEKTGCWIAALLVNCTVYGAIGAGIGISIPYVSAKYQEPCISAKNTYAVRQCAWESEGLNSGMVIGASVGVAIGALITGIGLFLNPNVEGAIRCCIVSCSRKC